MMKPIKVLMGVILLLLIIAYSSPLPAQELNAFMSTVKKGDWIRFAGIPQPDFSILVQEIEVIREEMEDDNWEVSGVVSQMETEENTIHILYLPIKLDGDTKYIDDEAKVTSINSIKPDMEVEVEGRFSMDGIFFGDAVTVKRPDAGEKNLVRWTGQVEGVELESNLINVLAHIIILTPETKIVSSAN